jgi:hypothetical protein
MPKNNRFGDTVGFIRSLGTLNPPLLMAPHVADVLDT